jgi:hypothetical protein
MLKKQLSSQPDYEILAQLWLIGLCNIQMNFYCARIINKISTYFEKILREHRNIHGLIVLTPASLAMFSRSAVLFTL